MEMGQSSFLLSSMMLSNLTKYWINVDENLETLDFSHRSSCKLITIKGSASVLIKGEWKFEFQSLTHETKFLLGTPTGLGSHSETLTFKLEVSRLLLALFYLCP